MPDNIMKETHLPTVSLLTSSLLSPLGLVHFGRRISWSDLGNTMCRLLSSALLSALLFASSTSGQQTPEWEDVALDFARSLKPLRAASATPWPGITNDISSQLAAASQQFARSHADGGLNTIDMLQSASHAGDGLAAYFAISCLAQLDDTTHTDPILLKWLEDGSYSVEMALSYLPAERARQLLAEAIRIKPQSSAVSLLGLVGNADDLKLLRELASQQPRPPHPRRFGDGNGFGGGIRSDYAAAASDLEFQLKLPEAKQADWRHQELLFFRASRITLD